MRPYLRSANGLGDFLESEYQHRKAKNPSYSYRAFGRDLKLSPSHLNGILHKKSGLSHERIASLSSFLRLTEEEKDYLWALTEKDFAKAKAVKSNATQKLDEYRGKQSERVLTSDELESIGDWQYFALIEALKTRGGTTLERLSNLIGLPSTEIDQYLRQLERLGLVSQQNEEWKSIAQIATESSLPSATIRKTHRALVKRAYDSIERQTVRDRYLSSSLLAVKSSDRERAFAMIENFVIKFNAEFGLEQEGEEVYAFTLQFFNLLANSKDS